jgi:hypothetical protein
MKKCLVMFVFFLLSLFTASVLGGLDEESMDVDKQNVVAANYQQTAQTSQE